MTACWAPTSGGTKQDVSVFSVLRFANQNLCQDARAIQSHLLKNSIKAMILTGIIGGGHYEK